jgi:Na+-transporting methylmalonyl-CoA/oxaloacetate decarboxylase gamma subunit
MEFVVETDLGNGEATGVGLRQMADTSQGNLRGLLRIAAFSTAIGFGSVAGSLYSLRQSPSGLTFVFTVGTLVAFAVGAVAGWLYWRVLDRMIVRANTPGSPKKLSRFLLLNVAAGFMGLLAFLYPIRFVQRERLREVLEGMGAAFLVLAILAVALWRVIKFFNSETEGQGEE